MKKLAIFLGSSILILFISIFFLENWVENKFEKALNNNPDRKYDLTYDNLKVSFFQGDIKLERLKITPLNIDSLPTEINGSVEKATLEGISFIDFLTSKEITIDNLSFLNPDFTLVHKDFPKTHSETSKPFQSLFGDIISRGEIRNFSLLGGKAELFFQKDSLEKIGSFDGLDIVAFGLETDSVQVGRTIPFRLENLAFSLDNLIYNLSSNQVLNLGSFQFDLLKGQMDLKRLSLKLSSSWEEHAKNQPFQKEVMEFDIGILAMKGLSTESSFYDSLMIISQTVEIDSLIFNVGKDKNRPKLPEVIKKDFSNLLETLSFPLAIDSLIVKNSHITYSEIELGKNKPGIISIGNLNGLILNVSSIESVERENSLIIDIKAKFNDSGDLNLHVDENYFERKWKVDLLLESMDMMNLNQTVNHLAGIAIESGEIQKLHLKMEGNPSSSDNHFLLEYKDLKMDLLNKEDEKKGFLSSVANLAIHKQNLPGDKHYKELLYSTKRDIYKGPINLIWLSVKDGLMATIPTQTVQKLMPHPKEAKLKKSETKAEKKANKKAKNN